MSPDDVIIMCGLWGVDTGAMSLPETSLPEPNQMAQITLKPKIHTSQLITTVNQKISLEVTVLEVTRHRGYRHRT